MLLSHIRPIRASWESLLDAPADTYPTALPQAPGPLQGTQGPAKVRKPEARSRVSMGKRLLPLADGRSIWARMFADFYAALVSHCGGEDYLSEPRRMLCRRAALYETELVVAENQLGELRSKGYEPDLTLLDTYNRLAGNQRRTLETLGLDRTARELVPTLSTYIREIEAQRG
jgi:hypothetical protein